MADLSGLQCFFDAEIPNDVLICLISVGEINAWSVIFIGLLVFFTIAFSLFMNIGKGMMIGGFFMTLAGLALLALGLINVSLWFLALLICLVGLVISAINASDDD